MFTIILIVFLSCYALKTQANEFELAIRSQHGQSEDLNLIDSLTLDNPNDPNFLRIRHRRASQLKCDWKTYKGWYFYGNLITIAYGVKNTKACSILCRNYNDRMNRRCKSANYIRTRSSCEMFANKFDIDKPWTWTYGYDAEKDPTASWIKPLPCVETAQEIAKPVEQAVKPTEVSKPNEAGKNPTDTTGQDKPSQIETTPTVPAETGQEKPTGTNTNSGQSPTTDPNSGQSPTTDPNSGQSPTTDPNSGQSQTNQPEGQEPPQINPTSDTNGQSTENTSTTQPPNDSDTVTTPVVPPENASAQNNPESTTEVSTNSDPKNAPPLRKDLKQEIIIISGQNDDNKTSGEENVTDRSQPLVCGKTLVEPHFTLPTMSHGARIVGGKQSIPHSLPWTLSLQRTNDGPLLHFCGGALIRVTEANESDIAVSAAHCLYGDHAPEGLEIAAGVHNIWMDEDGVQRSKGVKWKLHEEYNNELTVNDISIIKLEKPIKFTSTVQPVCLPEPGEVVPLGKLGIVAGWGSTFYGGYANQFLLQVVVPAVNMSKCIYNYQHPDEEDDTSKVFPIRMLCAGYFDGNKDTCQGDSGGPLVFKSDRGFVLQGVVSFGPNGCALPKLPGIYTRISHYVDWIKKQAMTMSSLIPGNDPSPENTSTQPTAGTDDGFKISFSV